MVSQGAHVLFMSDQNAHRVCDSPPCKAGSCIRWNLCVMLANFYLQHSESLSLRTDGSISPILTLSGRYTPDSDTGDGRLLSISRHGYWPLHLSSPCWSASISRRLITVMWVYTIIHHPPHFL